MALHFANLRAAWGVLESSHADRAYDPYASTLIGSVMAVFR